MSEVDGVAEALARCDTASDLLAEAVGLPPGAPLSEAQETVAEALRQAARLRDLLIAARRGEPGSVAVPAAAIRPALDHANAALSALAGFAYPLEGFRRESLELALASLLACRSALTGTTAESDEAAHDERDKPLGA